MSLEPEVRRAIQKINSRIAWYPIEDAPKYELILVWCPPREGLSELFALCQWHEDAGFCVDELREPKMFAYLRSPK